MTCDNACNEAKHLIADQFDGPVDSASEASLEIHLRSCPACRRYAAQMDALRGALRSLNEETAPLADEPARQPARRRRLGLGALSGLAAAVALLITSGVFIMNEGSSPGLARLTPSATPRVVGLAPEVSEQSRATVVLTHSSAAKYIPVERESSRPDVHMFMLFSATPTTRAVN